MFITEQYGYAYDLTWLNIMQKYSSLENEATQGFLSSKIIKDALKGGEFLSSRISKVALKVGWPA